MNEKKNEKKILHEFRKHTLARKYLNKRKNTQISSSATVNTEREKKKEQKIFSNGDWWKKEIGRKLAGSRKTTMQPYEGDRGGRGGDGEDKGSVAQFTGLVSFWSWKITQCPSQS